MFEKLLFVAIGVVGVFGAVAGTLPASLVALFGDPSVLAPVSVNPSIAGITAGLGDVLGAGTNPLIAGGLAGLGAVGSQVP